MESTRTVRSSTDMDTIEMVENNNFTINIKPKLVNHDKKSEYDPVQNSQSDLLSTKTVKAETTKADNKRKLKDSIRISFLILSSTALIFFLSEKLGESVVLVPIMIMVFSQRPVSTTSVGEMHQTLLAILLAGSVGILAGYFGVLVSQTSFLRLVIWSFMLTFWAFYYSFLNKDHALPSAFGIIVAYEILLSGFFALLNLDQHQSENETGSHKSVFYDMSSIMLVLLMSSIILFLSSVLLFPWFASDDLNTYMMMTRNSLALMLDMLETKLHCLICIHVGDTENQNIQAYLSDWDRWDDLVSQYRENYSSASKLLYPSRCEKRWRFDGSGIADLYFFSRLLDVTRFSSILYATLKDFGESDNAIKQFYVDETGKCNRVKLLSLLKDVLSLSGRMLQASNEKNTVSMMEYDEVLDAKLIEFRRILKELDSSELSGNNDGFFILISSIVEGFVKTLKEASLIRMKSSTLTFKDWSSTLPFNLFTSIHELHHKGKSASAVFPMAPGNRDKKKIRKAAHYKINVNVNGLLSRITLAWRKFAGTDEYSMAIKVAMASVLYVSIFISSHARQYVRVGELVVGLFSLHSVLRQFYIGQCWKRFLDRCTGALLAFVVFAIAWLISTITPGSSTPALSGWSLFIFMIPLTTAFIYTKLYAPQHMYKMYTMCKNYASISAIAYFQVVPENKYTNFWYVNVFVTSATIVGCSIGFLCCPVFASVSAKSALRHHLSHVLQQLVYITEAGFFTRRRNRRITTARNGTAYVDDSIHALLKKHVDLMETAHRYTWSQLTLKAPAILKAAEAESRIEESSDWFSEALKQVSNINRQLWRFNHLPSGLTSSTVVNEKQHEFICSQLASALYNLSKHFSEPQLGFVLWQHHGVKTLNSGDQVSDFSLESISDTNFAENVPEAGRETATDFQQTFCWSLARSMFSSIDHLHYLIEQRNGLPEYAMIETRPGIGIETTRATGF